MKKQKYYEIVFLQGEEAIKPLEILTNEGEEEALQYMCQWDYGDYGEDVTDNPSGKDDTIYENNYYIMVYNTRFGYIGLIKKITEEE